MVGPLLDLVLDHHNKLLAAPAFAEDESDARMVSASKSVRHGDQVQLIIS